MPEAINPIRVLVVEDEPIVAEAYEHYLGRLDGFVHAGSAGAGHAALRLLSESAETGTPVDLVLMDMNLPDLHGLDVCRRMRSAGLMTDIIAITAVRDVRTVRGAIAAGIVTYLIKPFTYATFADKLVQYRDFRRQLDSEPVVASQAGLDLAFASLRAPTELPRPKGLGEDTLAAVVSLLQEHHSPVSAQQVAERVGISRVTARRYLEYLADEGSALRSPRYGAPGRPENEYAWKRAS